jgi:AraC family transcriptional regulator of adaptative response/methylated-DNA-[protein]-cysteine methyltransferase
MVTEENINYLRIEQAIQFLEKNFQHQPTLDEVADVVYLSPFHFQRLFTEWAGISPKRFMQYLTVDFLKDRLAESKNLADAAASAGLSGQSRVYDLFTTLEAVTPREYKEHGSGIRIEYGFQDTPFGLCLIGITLRGICWLSFVSAEDGRHDALEAMKKHWHNSVFQQNDELAASFADRIFSKSFKKNDRGDGLCVFVKGTNFQIKVWEALLKIPAGNVITYQSIAESIQRPKAMQAVGSAVGSNHVAYLIPCHRVIRKDGILGEYRWGSVRKKSIIGREMAQTTAG